MARVNYFKGAETLEDVRTKLIEHLKSIDPKSAKLDTMIEQYVDSCGTYERFHRNKRGKVYEVKTGVAISPSEFTKMIKRILAMDGVNHYVEGQWVWFNGNTKAHRAELNALKDEINKSGIGIMEYSGKRKEWYFKDCNVA